MGKSGVARQSVPLKKRSIILRYLVIVVPFWLSAKFFLGPYQDFVRTYFAAVLFLLLLALIVQMILPKVAEKKILFSLFFLLSAIELLYLVVPGMFAPLQVMIGQYTFIGGAYTVNLIPYYGVSAFIGYFILKSCRA